MDNGPWHRWRYGASGPGRLRIGQRLQVVIRSPQDDYTKLLLDAIPNPYAITDA